MASQPPPTASAVATPTPTANNNNNTTTTAGASAPPPPRLATLYVGDLAPDVSEPSLFEFFSKFGQVISVRVCRDMTNQTSLGYGYVNFQNTEDAARVIDSMNYTPLSANGRPMRIMWYQRDPTLRKSGVGNVFVKDLNRDIDDKQLSETFSVFGRILSAKVSRDKEGKSNGYGFVHFESEEDASNSIEKMNGMQLNGVKVFVGAFKRRRERFAELESTFSNVFFRNVSHEIPEEQFIKKLGKFGKVLSAFLGKVEKFQTQYGFANFESHEEALKCIEDCNGKVIPELSGTEPLYASRAMKRRERHMARQIEMLSRIGERQLANLYVKNLPDGVDDTILRDLFTAYGNTISCKVQRDQATGLSKGFGYVAYKTKESADKALQEMNGKLMQGKPLYVAFHQTAEQRRRQLENRRQNPNSIRWPGFSAPQQPQSIPASMPSIYPYPNPWQTGMIPSYYGMRPQLPMGMKQPMMFPRGPAFPGGMGGSGGIPQQQQRMMRPPQPGGPRGGVLHPGAPGLQRPGGQPGQPQGPPHLPGGKTVPTMGGAGRSGAGVNHQQHPQHQQQVLHHQQPKSIPGMYGLPNLTSAELAAMSPEEQKNALGERLYSRIYAMNPEQAAKITGMLLEMDTTEILNVLEDNAVMKNKIDEALNVLRVHQDK